MHVTMPWQGPGRLTILRCPSSPACDALSAPGAGSFSRSLQGETEAGRDVATVMEAGMGGRTVPSPHIPWLAPPLSAVQALIHPLGGSHTMPLLSGVFPSFLFEETSDPSRPPSGFLLNSLNAWFPFYELGNLLIKLPVVFQGLSQVPLCPLEQFVSPPCSQHQEHFISD